MNLVMRMTACAVPVLALLSSSCPSSTACGKTSDCTNGQVCVQQPDGTGSCTAVGAEGEGGTGEGEGSVGEGEGEGSVGEGEGEGSVGEGEGEGAPLSLGAGVFTSGAAASSSASFRLHGGFVSPVHVLVSESATFRLTSLR